MPYSGIFGVEYFKIIIVIFEFSTLEFVKNEILTHTVNFGIWSLRLRSAFCDDPGPSTSPLYKVCPSNTTKFIYSRFQQFVSTKSLTY